ncbi:VCBS repeat-containing protein [candidate division KSB1 bacterium]|nr:VCBS repeat-containing protein [candidate division KSB1 bacterium]
MKRLILTAHIILWLTTLGFSQDIPLFEVADNSSLGLFPVFLDRWGCSASDIDRNGWPDIYNNKWRGRLESQIYMNNEGYFTDIYGNSPQLVAAELDGNATRTPVLVDFDNDGDRDLMLGTDYNLFMFRNDNNVFVDITDALGIESGVPGFVSIYGYEMSAWIDWDRDGDLDALVAQTNNPDFIFYRNDGDQFVDIADEVGLAGQNELGSDGDRGYNTCRIQWIDWDLDGDPDLSAGWKLFRNDDNHLTDVSDEVGFLPYHKIRFCDWFDYDLDGDFDFFMQGYDLRDEIWQNNGGVFTNMTQETGLDLFVDNGQASLNVADFDNDADEDCFFSINDHEDIEAFLLNDYNGGMRSFVEVASWAGFGLVGDRKGAAVLDYDMDGLLDIFCPSLDYGSLVYHNLGPVEVNNWLGLDLWGTKSNKDALGTLVTLYAGDIKLIRYTRAARTWKVQDNPYVNFGIGQATSIDSIVINWPMGDKQVFTDLEINKYHKIIELEPTAVDAQSTAMPDKIALFQNYPNPFNPTTAIQYNIPRAENVSLKIYNLQGEEIITLIADELQPEGFHSISWNGTDKMGHIVPTGMYIYQLRVGDYSTMKKMTFIK